jgi:hypothetical protein
MDPNTDPAELSRPAPRRDGLSMPVPDPTTLTREAVDRATEQWQRELFHVQRLLETRLDAMDKATELRLGPIMALPEQIHQPIHDLRELVRERFADTDHQREAQREWLIGEITRVSDVSGERFAAIGTRFDERDERTRQAALESRISLDAALAAAKEAVGQQNESNTRAIQVAGEAVQKQIDALTVLMSSSIASLEIRIRELKERLDKGEGTKQGGKETLTGVYALLGAFATVLTIAGILLATRIR